MLAQELSYSDSDHNSTSLWLRRTVDVVRSIVGLILLLPLLVIVAIIIKLDSSGPVFFCQERVG